VSPRAPVEQFLLGAIDVRRGFAAERDCEAVSARRWSPRRVERPNRRFGIERESKASRKGRFGMSVPFSVGVVRESQPQPFVEADRAARRELATIRGDLPETYGDAPREVRAAPATGVQGQMCSNDD
jgi:hypothetical protein